MNPKGSNLFQASISTQLLKIVFSLYCLIAISLTGMEMRLEYNNSKAIIIKNLNNFQKTFEVGLGKALWNYDNSYLNSTLNGVLQVPFIVGMSIFDIKGNEFLSGGTILDQNNQKIFISPQGNKTFINNNVTLYHHGFTISAIEGVGYKKTRVPVGKVVFYSSSEVVFDNVKQGFALMILNAFLKSFALWMLFSWVLQKYLGKPLNNLTSSVKSINLESLENFHIDLKQSKNNELKALEDAFTDMVQNLITSKSKLDQARRRLELLLETTRGMSITGIIPHTIMEKALLFIFQLLPVTYNSKITIHYRQREKDRYGYPSFKIPLKFQNDKPILKMDIGSLEHAFSCDSPIKQPPIESVVNKYLNGDELKIACWDNKNLLGLITITAINTDEFDDDHLIFVKTLKESLTISLKNVEAYWINQDKIKLHTEMELAAQVQLDILPTQLPDFGDYIDIARYYQPALATGGDWFQFMTEIKGHFFIFIGDVTGHGMPAAMVATSVSASLKMIEEGYKNNKNVPTPPEILKVLNRIVYQSTNNDYLITAFLVSVNLKTGTMSYANAGHNFPFLIRNDSVQRLLVSGKRLGELPEQDYDEAFIELKADDRLFFYTDGVTENENKLHQMWGEPRLIRFLKKYAKNTANEIVESLVEELDQFHESTQIEDDVTILVCHFKNFVDI